MSEPVLVADERDICPAGWAGCDNWTGGHLCHRDFDHKGMHRCDCGAEKRRTTNDVDFCGCCGINNTPNFFCTACWPHIRGGGPPWERMPPTCPLITATRERPPEPDQNGSDTHE